MTALLELCAIARRGLAEPAAEKTFTAKLKFADPKATYELKDADTGRARMLSGTDLRERGFAITEVAPDCQ